MQYVCRMDTMLYIKKIEKACSTGNFEEKDKNGKQVLSKQQNEFVYELIIQKYQQSIFKKKVGAIGDTIIEKREKFAEISLEEQCKVLMQIFLNFQSGIGVELKIIEGGKKSGVTYLNKKVMNVQELKLIDQSVTGVFSREIDLLTI